MLRSRRDGGCTDWLGIAVDLLGTSGLLEFSYVRTIQYEDYSKLC